MTKSLSKKYQDWAREQVEAALQDLVRSGLLSEEALQRFATGILAWGVERTSKRTKTQSELEEHQHEGKAWRKAACE